MSYPEGLHTPEKEIDHAVNRAIGAAAWLVGATMSSTVAVRLDSGLESMSMGVVAGIGLSYSFANAKHSIGHYRQSRQMRAASDHSSENLQ